jgi:hypothetical protein
MYVIQQTLALPNFGLQGVISAQVKHASFGHNLLNCKNYGEK